MSYLEELLPKFRKGAKIRQKDWEFYQEPIDWDYIIENKCLCYFWNDKGKKFIKFLQVVEKCGYRDEYGVYWQHCQPVRRDEVTFYEDRNDNR